MQFGLDFVRKCGFRERSVRSHLVARCYLVPCMWWCQTWEQFSLIPLRTTGWHGRRGVVLPDSRGMCCMNVGRCGGRSVDTPAGGPHQPQLRATCLASECVWPDNGRAGYKGHLPGTRLRGLTGLPSIPPRRRHANISGSARLGPCDGQGGRTRSVPSVLFSIATQRPRNHLHVCTNSIVSQSDRCPNKVKTPRPRLTAPDRVVTQTRIYFSYL